MKPSGNEKAPHSIAFWIRLESHERMSNGRCSGHPTDKKECHGILNCENKKEAEEIISKLIDVIKEEFEKCQQELQSKSQKILNQPE